MKIGFVDYYISEWHANNYPRWIAQMCEQHGFDATVAYAWAERDVSLVDGVDTDTWCTENGAQRCMSIDELCEKTAMYGEYSLKNLYERYSKALRNIIYGLLAKWYMD